MQQLSMYWKNDGVAPKAPEVPVGCEIVTYPELDGAKDKWLDIVQHGLSIGRKTEEYYHRMMLSLELYREDKCFFLLENGQAVATVTVLCNYETNAARIHMVACAESARGKGYGTLLSKLAEYVLKREGMQTARLSTDDWRIPAIKSYLGIGFAPDLSTDDFKERWGKIYEQIGRELAE